MDILSVQIVFELWQSERETPQLIDWILQVVLLKFKFNDHEPLDYKANDELTGHCWLERSFDFREYLDTNHAKYSNFFL